MPGTRGWSVNVLLLFDAVGRRVEVDAVVAGRAGQAPGAGALSSIPVQCRRGAIHSVQGMAQSWLGIGSQLSALPWRGGLRGILVGKCACSELVGNCTLPPS